MSESITAGKPTVPEVKPTVPEVKPLVPEVKPLAPEVVGSKAYNDLFHRQTVAGTVAYGVRQPQLTAKEVEALMDIELKRIEEERKRRRR